MALCVDCLAEATVQVEQPGYWPAPVGLCGECWDGYQQMHDRIQQMFERAMKSLAEQASQVDRAAHQPIP